MLQMQNDTFLTRMKCNRHDIVLAFLWVLGLLVGMLFGHFSTEWFDAFFHQSALQHISLPGIAVVQLLPLLLSAMCVLVRRPGFLLILLFADAVSCGFNIYGITAAFGSAAWLVYEMLCFSDTITAILLLWLSVRQFSGRKYYFEKDLVKCLIISLVIGTVDISCISPFLVTLMNHS